MYTDAHKENPSNPSYVLNLVHTLEVVFRYQEAFDIIVEFCKKNPKLSVGSVSCGQVYQVASVCLTGTHSNYR